MRTTNPYLPAAVLAVLAIVLSSCAGPTLTNLDQNSGPEHSIVMIQGTNLLFARIVWDAGLASERIIPGGFLGAFLFSVPPGASQGNHSVAVENSRGRSATMDFNVTAPQPFGAPRIDRVMIGNVTFDGAGNLNSWLYVQGANIDVGAVAQLDGGDVATVAHKALRNDLYGVVPTSLAYPIYHYVALIAVAGSRPAGSNLAITVTNLDGQASPAFSYTLPADASSLDSDGDGLLDSWEKNGYDSDGDGAIDINLPALGADPFRTDVLLEVDVMNGLANPPIASAPGNPGTFDQVIAMFAAAPIINPGPSNGINLILDTSGAVPLWNIVGFNAVDNVLLSTANFSTLKAANFNNAIRGNIYHYAIWANAMPGGFSGISDINIPAGLGGDDLIVSFDDFAASFQTLRSQVETLAHEFGHNLGQRHGGDNDSRYKPNYWSVMSYTWQLRTGQNNATRLQRVTCAAFYYATAGATEPNGALPAGINATLDYSEGMAATLVENNNSLNETTGVCGVPVDWNDDGDQTDANLNANVDDNVDNIGNPIANETVSDFANWRALNFQGPVTNGTVLP